MNIWLLSLLTWIMFVPIAIVNGIVREKLYKPYVGDLTAHQISTIIASVLYIALVYFLFGNRIHLLPIWQLLGIGLLWVVMTIAFEFGFGHFVDHAPWERLLADYNLFTGHVWGLFLLVILFSPLLVKLLTD